MTGKCYYKNVAHLTFISIDDHSHPLHVYSFFYDPLETFLKPLVEIVQMFRRYGSYVYRQINESCTSVLSEIDIGTRQRLVGSKTGH